MKFKMNGATPEAVKSLLSNLLSDYDLEMDSINIYVNFTKNGRKVVPIDTKTKEVIDDTTLIANNNPNEESDWHIKDLRFIEKSVLDEKIKEMRRKQREEVERRQQEYEEKIRESHRLSQIGWIGVGQRDSDGVYKLYRTNKEPDDKFRKDKKEKYGYTVKGFIHTNHLDQVEKYIKRELWREYAVGSGYYKFPDDEKWKEIYDIVEK